MARLTDFTVNNTVGRVTMINGAMSSTLMG
jgi:hypothetical protein